MRAFKTLTLVCLVFYLIAITKPTILNNFFGWQNYEKEYLYQELDKTNPGEPRVVIFGSSHCDFGLSAKDIGSAIGYKTFNFCQESYDTEENFNKLLSHVNKNDYLIYAKRAVFIKKNNYLINEDTLNKFPLKNLIPNFISMMRSPRGGDYSSSGDMATYPTPEKFDYPNYKFNLKIFNENLDTQLGKIFQNKSSNQPQLILITAPLLSRNSPVFSFTETEPHCLQCPNFKKWIPPLLLDNKDYFIDSTHVSAQGKIIWTNQIILEMQKIKSLDQTSNNSNAFTNRDIRR
jgi:hypothetical protein